MKIVKNEFNPKTRVSLFDLQKGQCGITDAGAIYYRTLKTATCLTDVGQTITNISGDCHILVTQIPKGTKITVEMDV